MPVAMHVLNVIDLIFAGFFGIVGAICFYRAISVWRVRNGGVFTQAFCAVLACEGVAGTLSLLYLGYIWHTGVAVPELSYSLFLAEKTLQAFGWLFVLVFVVPRIVP